MKESIRIKLRGSCYLLYDLTDCLYFLDTSEEPSPKKKLRKNKVRQKELGDENSSVKGMSDLAQHVTIAVNLLFPNHTNVLMHVVQNENNKNGKYKKKHLGKKPNCLPLKYLLLPFGNLVKQ